MELKTVETLTGTGIRGTDPEGGNSLLEQDITSPWDIVHWKDEKYIIAMAGIHQIWILDMNEKSIKNFSGSSAEGNYNNGLLNSTWA